MRFTTKEKNNILHQRKEYPELANLIEKQNAWDFQQKKWHQKYYKE